MEEVSTTEGYRQARMAEVIWVAAARCRFSVIYNRRGWSGDWCLTDYHKLLCWLRR